MFDAGMADKENLATAAFEEDTPPIGISPDGMDKHWLNVAPPRHVAGLALLRVKSHTIRERPPLEQ